MSEDMIIGVPGLKELGVSIDFSSCTVKANGEPVKVQVCLAKEIDVRKISKIEEWNTADMYQVFVRQVKPDKRPLPRMTGEEEADRTPETTGDIPAELQEFLGSVIVDAIAEGLPPKRGNFDMEIDLKDGVEVLLRPPYKLGIHENAVLREMIEEALEKGIIRPSISRYAAPCMLVGKKDGSFRLVIDYRDINKATLPVSHPMPDLQEAIDQLVDAKIFSTMDLISGFNQLRLSDAAIEKTAFRTREGHYEYLVVPFGLKNSPPYFARFLTEILRKFIGRCVVLYIDDILIYSVNREQHIEDCKAVLLTLKEHFLTVKRKKCDFFKSEVEFIGFKVSKSLVVITPTYLSGLC